MAPTLPPGGGAFALKRFGPMCACSLEECRRVRAYLSIVRDMTSGHAPDRFVDDQAAVFGAAYALVLAGEAAGRMAQSFRNDTGEIPWGELMVVRHRLAHAETPPDPALIAALAYDHAPVMLDLLDALLFDVEGT